MFTFKNGLNAAFTHAGLTTRYQTKSLYKRIFVLSRSSSILFVKQIDSLLHTVSKKFKFEKLESLFHKHKVSFLVVKTVKCKRGITLFSL